MVFPNCREFWRKWYDGVGGEPRRPNMAEKLPSKSLPNLPDEFGCAERWKRNIGSNPLPNLRDVLGCVAVGAARVAFLRPLESKQLFSGLVLLKPTLKQGDGGDEVEYPLISGGASLLLSQGQIDSVRPYAIRCCTRSREGVSHDRLS